MKFKERCVHDIQIAYIGGGSRGWAWKFMADLALEPCMSGTIKLYDIDYERACQNEKIGNRLSEREDCLGKWKYKAVPCLDEALDEADFVVVSILPGTFDDMESDVHTPEKYGIYQSVGDTTGPGGLIRAMRTLPVYENLAEMVKKYCPKAWVINYTNPMTLCVRMLYEVYPEIKAFGCCHEIFGTQRMLANIYGIVAGDKGIPRSDIKINVLGINHFTWIDRAHYGDIDLFPIYDKFSKDHYQSGVEGIEKDHWLNKYFQSSQRVKFDLFQKFGLIAAAGDRHLAEFVPRWYLRNPEDVDAWKFALTPVSWRKERAVTLMKRSEHLAGGVEEIDLKPSGEEGVAQIKALLGLESLVTNVNIPNRGQCPDMPLKAVVETNAVFQAGEVRPVMAGTLPEEVRNLVMVHVLNQETIIQGFRNRDKEKIFRAFLNDPAMGIRGEDARRLFEEMLHNTKESLPEWLK